MLSPRCIHPHPTWWDHKGVVAEQHRLVCFKKKDIAVDKFNVASRQDFEAAVQAIGTGREMRNANVAGHRTGREKFD
jgi:hypothetical protein